MRRQVTRSVLSREAPEGVLQAGNEDYSSRFPFKAQGQFGALRRYFLVVLRCDGKDLTGSLAFVR